MPITSAAMELISRFPAPLTGADGEADGLLAVDEGDVVDDRVDLTTAAELLLLLLGLPAGALPAGALPPDDGLPVGAGAAGVAVAVAGGGDAWGALPTGVTWIWPSEYWETGAGAEVGLADVDLMEAHGVVLPWIWPACRVSGPELTHLHAFQG